MDSVSPHPKELITAVEEQALNYSYLTLNSGYEMRLDAMSRTFSIADSHF
jgi:hypothetical protein